MKDSLGNRIKENYEKSSRFFLTKRTPVIIRVDGKAFHTLTRSCDKPFDENFIRCMKSTALKLLDQIQGAKVVYVQSDEISVLLTDYDSLETDAWFNYNIQKMASISASIAAVNFSQQFKQTGHFDSRVFNVPKDDVANYFIWRYKDWLRNSLSMLGRAHFSQKEMNGKRRDDVHEMLHGIGVNWAKMDGTLKNGTMFYKEGSLIREAHPESMEEIRKIVGWFL